MLRPSMPRGRPGIVVGSLGGAVGTVLALAVLYGASGTGMPAVDVPSALGGVFVDDPTAAFWLGCALFFLGGWLVVPMTGLAMWGALPGASIGVPGALVKGLLIGLGVWLVLGLALGLVGAQPVPGGETPGFFAARLGPSGMLVLLVASVAHGLAFALVAAMSRGLSPLGSLGWMGHGAGRGA